MLIIIIFGKISSVLLMTETVSRLTDFCIKYKKMCIMRNFYFSQYITDITGLKAVVIPVYSVNFATTLLPSS